MRIAIPLALLVLSATDTIAAPPARRAGEVPSTRPSPTPADPAERAPALQEALAALKAGHTTEAARRLRAVADRFHSAQALLHLARLQSGQGDAAGARDSLRQALGLAPNSEEVLSAYAQVSLASGAPLPAILALEPLTRMCASVGQYHYLLGVALMQAGDMPAATEALERAEALEPNRLLTLVALGLSLNARKLYAEARPHLERSLELEPERAEALAALAESEEGLGELGPAETHARRVLAGAAGNATANLVMGMVLMKQERYEDARAALERAAAADPSSSKAHYQLSLAFARLGDDARSRQHLDEYQRKLKEIEERVKQVRSESGLAQAPRP